MSRGAQRLFYPPDSRDTNDHGFRPIIPDKSDHLPGLIDVMNEIGAKAEARGLTPEILETLLS
jgi:hypothetical protein